VVAAGEPARARVSARRSASGSRYRPAMRRTRSAASTAGIPAAVTNSGRSEDPRTTGSAWVAVRNRDLGHPDHRDAELGVRVCAQAGPAARVQIGVAIDHEQAQLAQVVQDRAAAGVRAGRIRPAGRALPGALPRCVRPARARRRHRRPARLLPGRRRSSGNARRRRRTRRSLRACRFPCLEDARTCARHQDRILAAAGTGPQQAVQRVTKRNWSVSSTRTCNRPAWPLIGRAEGTKIRLLAVGLGARHLAPIVELCQAGRIATVIDRRYRLPEAPEALRYLGEGHAKARLWSSSTSLWLAASAPMTPWRWPGSNRGSCVGRAGFVYAPGPLGAGQFRP
jgi:hypothetical protein